MKIVAMILLCCIALMFVAGCTTITDATPDGSARNVGVPADDCKPLDFHNGVYYFPCREAPFVKRLSQFIGETNYTLLAMSDDTTGHYVNGYYVVVKEK